jgi:hypothetical protein
LFGHMSHVRFLSPSIPFPPLTPPSKYPLNRSSALSSGDLVRRPRHPLYLKSLRGAPPSRIVHPLLPDGCGQGRTGAAHHRLNLWSGMSIENKIGRRLPA